jgi:hypothetical protein
MNLETSRESGAIHYPQGSFLRRINKAALRSRQLAWAEQLASNPTVSERRTPN